MIIRILHEGHAGGEKDRAKEERGLKGMSE
jgi:hypothetical protein